MPHLPVCPTEVGGPGVHQPAPTRSCAGRRSAGGDINAASFSAIRLLSGALTSTLHWFETDLLTRAENLVGLTAVNRELLARAALATRAERVVLDMDSSESPVHGVQEGSAYNGHFATGCYHPLFLFNDQGDCRAPTGTDAPLHERGL